MMTEDQMLELAEKLKFCLRDEDDFRMWKVSPSLILEFARTIYQNGYDDCLKSIDAVCDELENL
jgi:hypothetical protein